MGHHYVPQKYLRGFAEFGNPTSIWMYDKKLHKFTNPDIKSIAQESSFYNAEVEQQLNEYVEKPANLVLEKLRNNETINDQDRFCLAVYIATMMKRVPRRRKKAISLLPATYDKVFKEIRSEIKEMALVSQNKELFESRLSELDKIEQKTRSEIPNQIIEQIRTPWASKTIIDSIYTMSWLFLFTKEPYFFLTSDNPAFFFEGYGIARPESELTFPIAKNIVLFAHRQGERNSSAFLEANEKLVKEANTRVASGAIRFVFAHKKEEWIAKLSNNSKPYLKRIIW